MKILNAVLSGFLALGITGWLPMMGIFGGGAAAQADQVALGNTIMWLSFALGLATLVLNIWGQIKYAKLQDGASTRIPLLMMYSGVPFLIFYVAFMFIFVFES